ncbi:MAG: hypothetical protein NVSMB62_10950 [Acidobacteriaceae bacterium]
MMSLQLRLLVLSLLFAVLLALPGNAQQPVPAAAGGSVHGLVVDPDDALVPGATVTVTSAAGKSQITTSKSDGTYTLRGLNPGTYTVVVTAPGFAPFAKQSVRLTSGANVAVDAKLVIETESQQMTVTADAVNLSVDPENNASSTTISGDALQSLSDDPDELQTELQALAGPSAGPNGGQIYIDGFTGGQLPPKSSIMAIRINSNPFSAQYDQLGYGRIEIITKPGTDKYHGNANIQFSDKIFNTSTPFLGPSNSQPNYHTLFSFGSITGPIRTGMSFTLSGSYRDIQNNNIINPTAIYASSANSTTMCQPRDLTCNAFAYPTAARAAAAPQKRWDISPRYDVLLSQKNTLTLRYQYETGRSTSHGGGNALPDLGNTYSSSESEIQVSDTQLLSNKVINETRFEYQRAPSHSSPFNPGTGVVVQGVVSAFGTGGGSISSTLQSHIEAQNYTSVQLAKHFIRLGGRLRTTAENISSNGGQNGTILYSYLLDPCTDPNQTNRPSNCITGANIAVCDPQNTAPGSLISSYQCGIPFEFTQTKINNLTIHARETDFEPYAEDDWKISPNLTWSLGTRLEVQNYISSAHDFAPRTSIAYGIPRKNGKTTTVVRAGFGIFYNRYGLGQIANLTQNNGLNQNNVLYTYPGAACTPASVSNCAIGNGAGPGKSQIAVPGAGLRSAYVMQSAATIEQQVGKWTSLSVTYLNARGEHQFLTRVFPSGQGFCGSTVGAGSYVDCSQSEGVFRQNQLNTNVNVRTPKGLNLFGFYSANFANSNLSGITDPYHSAYDYGRAAFSVRSRLTVGGTIPLPYLITASPLLFANSGSPYDIRTGIDNNLDGVTNDRPAFAPGVTAANASCTNASNFTSIKSSTYTAGELYPEIPVNFCTGPANISFNLRLSRTFGFGPKTDSGAGQRGGGPGGPGGFGGLGGGGGHGGGRGGDFGGGRSGSNTGRKYNLSVGAQAFNLFNQVPYGTPDGTLTSSLFGRSKSLQNNGPFSSANAVRRVNFQLNFSF